MATIQNSTKLRVLLTARNPDLEFLVFFLTLLIKSHIINFGRYKNFMYYRIKLLVVLLPQKRFLAAFCNLWQKNLLENHLDN
jgi:hypothetical protein